MVSLHIRTVEHETMVTCEEILQEPFSLSSWYFQKVYRIFLVPDSEEYLGRFFLFILQSNYLNDPELGQISHTKTESSTRFSSC